MLKQKVLLVILTGIVIVAAGCVSARDHDRQVSALQNRLEDKQHRLEDAESQLETVQSERRQIEQSLLDTRAEAEELARLSESLERAKEQREQNLREMRELVRDISGMEIEPRAEGDFIVIENEILFDAGEIALKEDAKATIRDTVVPYLQEQLAGHDGQMVRIDGHTDGQPIRVSPWDDNYHLSVMRAHSVFTFLTEQGVPVQNLFIAGFGPNRPMREPAEPEEPVAENRRVEILVIPHRGDDIQRILEEFAN